MNWFKKRIKIAQIADLSQTVSNIAMGVVNGTQDINNAIEQLRPIAADNAIEVCGILTSFYNTVATDSGRRALTAMANEFCNGIPAPEQQHEATLEENTEINENVV